MDVDSIRHDHTVWMALLWFHAALIFIPPLVLIIKLEWDEWKAIIPKKIARRPRWQPLPT
jgi:hypothetical protein